MRLTTRIRGAAVVALAATALAAWGPPALAAGPDGDAVDAAEIAAEAVEVAVGPETGDVPFAEATGHSDTIAAETADIAVVAPVDAAEAIVIGAGDDEALDIGISLPVTASVEDAEVVDGDIVYVDEEAATSFVVDAQPDGARIVSVLESPEAMHEIVYLLDIPGETSPLVNAEGGVDLVVAGDDESGIVLSVGGFEAPWAVDARGVAQRTWYEVRGNSIIQHVKPSPDAVYPISADPSYRVCTPGAVSVALCVDFTRDETTRMWNSAAPLGPAAAAEAVKESACGKLPSKLKVRGVTFNPKMLCKVAVTVHALNMINNLRRAATTPGRCLQARLQIVGANLPSVDPFAVRRC